MVRYGRFRMASDGDRIHTAKAVASMTPACDNSFVKMRTLRFETGRDQLVRTTYYSQLLDIYYVEYILDFETNQRKPFLLARVQTCLGTCGCDASLPENPVIKYSRMSTPDIYHLKTINAVVGWIKISRNEWAIIDTSRNGMRVEFVDEEDDNLE
ncbi:hypothetical protein FRC10_007583 [Ceratobasidium sp. 414]|nr:hypothetical protein FRC10_007583 [Ceratobasidium sp. 414]